MGSLTGFLQLGECSPISITLLLLSQEKAGRVNESPNTPPINFMGKPLNVRGKTVTEKGSSERRFLLTEVRGTAAFAAHGAGATVEVAW